MTTTTAQFPAETDARGAFVRQQYRFRDRITADGSSGYPAEAGRYHLYVSLACPWAHRAIIVRKLLGLEDVVSMGVVDPVRDERGWAFRDGPGHGRDGVCNFDFLSDAYLRTDPSYEGRYTVPCVWDRVTKRLVTNNYPDVTIDFETQFTAFHRPGAPDLYPEALRPAIDEVNALVYRDVNNGVYKAGFATTQAAYEEAVTALFARLDWLEGRLAGQRYLVGEQLTEADVRLFTTLARFDAVYVGHFQVQPAAAGRLPQPVGLRARPLPAPGLRRDGRLRPHQAALLHDPRAAEPVADRAVRPAGRLARAARPGAVRVRRG